LSHIKHAFRHTLLRLEYAYQSAVENHVHRAPRLDSRRSLNLRIGIKHPRERGWRCAVEESRQRHP